MKTIEELVIKYQRLSNREFSDICSIQDEGWVEPTDPSTLKYREYMAQIAVMAERGCF